MAVEEALRLGLPLWESPSPLRLVRHEADFDLGEAGLEPAPGFRQWGF